ncbi:hypothetical protein T4B_3317 [Trichinella pseudospiralis]|uniref:Uncharacterized protein n=1 Tax=Trichinella pseudospiralis TaxID=6337 RepID=A0A0V1IEB4_TRIPS|nr:hypothetical protein T4B_3317 [Trichinella pseudospiralis]
MSIMPSSDCHTLVAVTPNRLNRLWFAYFAQKAQKRFHLDKAKKKDSIMPVLCFQCAAVCLPGQLVQESSLLASEVSR